MKNKLKKSRRERMPGHPSGGSGRCQSEPGSSDGGCHNGCESGTPGGEATVTRTLPWGCSAVRESQVGARRTRCYRSLGTCCCGSHTRSLLFCSKAY
uniref:Uncharacterized protein n=1 Tax=Mustela putorius furo TaxID=9669 RepID=M3Y5I7_MUSPF